MTKTLERSALQLYASVMGRVLPIPEENQPKLVEDLESDPFIDHALSHACCELYHSYGMWLAPATTALAMMKHCQFGQKANGEISQDGE